MQIELNQSTIESLINSALSHVTDARALPADVGGKYLIRTCTVYWVGEVEGVIGAFIQLKNASFVGNTGDFSDAIMKGTISQSYYVGATAVNSCAIVDITPWCHDLPTLEAE